MDYLTIEKANQLYGHDVEFSHLVDSMIELMKRLHLSPAN